MELNKEQKVNNNLAKYIVSTGDFTFTENDYKYVGRRFRYFFSFDSALEMYLNTLERLRTKYNQDRRGIRLSRVTFGKDGNIREHITLLLDMVEGKEDKQHESI